MSIKVYDGTGLQDGQSLCDSCRNAGVIRGRRLEELLVHCDQMPMHPLRITFKVTSCTDYSDAREPGYDELLEMAWILRPPPKRRAAGFV